jgi:hypothetical protein
LHWHRVVLHSSRVRGWTITPANLVSRQLDGMWRAE